MPQVRTNGQVKHFPYTTAGKKAAEEERKKMRGQAPATKQSRTPSSNASPKAMEAVAGARARQAAYKAGTTKSAGMVKPAKPGSMMPKKKAY